MTKKELEELVAQQAEQIAELQRTIGLLKNMKPMQTEPVKYVPVQQTVTGPHGTHSNSPWPNFTVMARATR
jgi:hypothetical protein